MFDSTTPAPDLEQPTPSDPEGDEAAVPSAPAGIAVVTECHSCGYESELPGPPPSRCPKCGASAWTRFARLTGNPQPTQSPDHRGSGARGPRGSRKRAAFDRPTHHVFHHRGHAVA
jgi:hypothetical protein